MKKALKKFVVAVLAWQVGRLYKKHQFKTIAVVGSIGKTSTKLAVARVLEASCNVRYQIGNYNDLVSVPLIFFGQELPSLLNPFAWLKVFKNNEAQIKGTFEFDVVVVELGTDGPGQIAAFKKYVKADLAIITALTPEHMEYFADLKAVAQEEMAVATFSKQLLVNIDLCPQEFLTEYSGGFISYSLHKAATFLMNNVMFQETHSSFTIQKNNTYWLQAVHDSFSEPQLYCLLAASAAADALGFTPAAITTGYKSVKPVPGRMQRLNGIQNTTIIDDTYNASPDATVAALSTIYRIKAPQKIALLGNMNELGSFSAEAHTKIGQFCDSQQLNLVVTLGKDANEFLAAAAEKNGCKVIRCASPYIAGKHIAEHIQDGGLILAKGSQNGVFAEEAIKQLLADPVDAKKLVRQSSSWLAIKQKQFGPPPSAFAPPPVPTEQTITGAN